MSKEATDLKYPMVDLITPAIMSLMYLNVLMTMNLMLLSAPRVFMEGWMKGLEGDSVGASTLKALSEKQQEAKTQATRSKSSSLRSLGRNADLSQL